MGSDVAASTEEVALGKLEGQRVGTASLAAVADGEGLGGGVPVVPHEPVCRAALLAGSASGLSLIGYLESQLVAPLLTGRRCPARCHQKIGGPASRLSFSDSPRL